MMAQAGRFYDDIVIGEVRESTPRTVTQEELIEFATRYDPQYFHADPAAAERSIFGELIASGIHSAALWRMLDHEISGDIRWICGIAWEEVRWPNPVHAGDTLRAVAEPLSTTSCLCAAASISSRFAPRRLVLLRRHANGTVQANGLAIQRGNLDD